MTEQDEDYLVSSRVLKVEERTGPTLNEGDGREEEKVNERGGDHDGVSKGTEEVRLEL